MRVIVHPADKGGCGHYRMIFPAEACAAQGHDVIVDRQTLYNVVSFIPTGLTGPQAKDVVGLADPKLTKREVDAIRSEVASARRRGLSETDVLNRYMPIIRGHAERTGRAQLNGADVIVFQRVLSRDRYEIMVACQKAGAAVVLEVDDDFHAVHARNPAWKATNPLNDPENNRDWLMKAAKLADLVTVTTPALVQRYGAHGRVAVLPNYVPAKYLTIEPGPYTEKFLDTIEGVTVGWAGSVITHPDDLEATGGAVGRVLDETGARFHVVGTGIGVGRRLGLSVEPTNTGWLPIEAYPEAIRQIDVGIVPLAAHPFNEAKSWLKGLEFASLGVPFVATATGPYRELARLGLGLLPFGDYSPWSPPLRMLVTNTGMREEIAGRGREIAKGLTYEANAWRWMEAWEQAVANRDRRRQEAAA